MKNNKGVALPQYAIIFGLIALAIMPILIIFGQKLNDAFASYVNSYKAMSTHINSNASSMIASTQSINNNPTQATTPINLATTTSGSVGTTNSNPVKQCTDGICTIDFGSFILKGIPSDLNQLVQTSGVSGGTDVVSTMLEQIADELKNNGDTQGYTDYMNMANLGHFMSTLQKTFESQANNCSIQSDPVICFKNYMDNSKMSTANITVPDNIKTLVPNLNTNIELGTLDNTYLYGNIRNDKINNPSRFNQYVTQSPPAAFINIYDKVMNNPNYSESLKGLTKELYNEIAVIGDKQTGMVCYTGYASYLPNTGQDNYYDPITGAQLPFPVTTSELTPDSILHPQTSVTTKLDSTLICAAGDKPDDGTQCATK